MRVILSRTPTFEAWLTRFDAWWGGRSKREQVMLGVLGALLLAVVLIFAVIKPLQAARADALADIRTAETYSARLRAAGTLAPSAPKRTGPPEAMVDASAAASGLVVTVQPFEGGVRATVADANYDSVLNFIADVGATTPLAVRKVSIQRLPAEGHVSAVVEFGS
jgi:general secretion pathway protein M